MAIIAKGGVIDHSLWDGNTVAAASIDATFFTVPKGGAKTKYHTNMTQAGQLAKGNSMKVMALSWAVAPGLAKASVIELAQAYYEVQVSTKIMSEGHLFRLPMGAALSADLDGAAAAVEVARIGVPDARDLHALSRSFDISDMESFEVRIYWPTALTAAFLFWFILHGEMTRPLN